MGLSTWKGDRPHKADVGVAKNYLTEVEVTALNRLTTMFLDFAEGMTYLTHPAQVVHSPHGPESTPHEPSGSGSILR